jgi:hypothetical protein
MISDIHHTKFGDIEMLTSFKPSGFYNAHSVIYLGSSLPYRKSHHGKLYQVFYMLWGNSHDPISKLTIQKITTPSGKNGTLKFAFKHFNDASKAIKFVKIKHT